MESVIREKNNCVASNYVRPQTRGCTVTITHPSTFCRKKRPALIASLVKARRMSSSRPEKNWKSIVTRRFSFTRQNLILSAINKYLGHVSAETLILKDRLISLLMQRVVIGVKRRSSRVILRVIGKHNIVWLNYLNRGGAFNVIVFVERQSLVCSSIHPRCASSLWREILLARRYCTNMILPLLSSYRRLYLIKTVH